MIRRQNMKWMDAFGAYPPYYVRLLAKSEGKGPAVARSDAEISIASGIPINRVREISRMVSWFSLEGDIVPEVLRFCAACNFDPSDAHHRKREQDYFQKCRQRGAKPFHYLRRHHKWHSEFLPLVKLLSERFSREQNPAAPVHAA